MAVRLFTHSITVPNQPKTPTTHPAPKPAPPPPKPPTQTPNNPTPPTTHPPKKQARQTHGRLRLPGVGWHLLEMRGELRGP